eukprot:TRINITY_DN16315_c0_g1_i3.p1 TRINITY_DN16315_c0_g1~~TRINITY_DN16315_c0_g1_i3.p1  ORF type:complete len:592 (-),score=102.36 TRINITY_DN16315_c0_g1_i3:47-1822(-)
MDQGMTPCSNNGVFPPPPPQPPPLIGGSEAQPDIGHFRGPWLRKTSDNGANAALTNLIRIQEEELHRHLAKFFQRQKQQLHMLIRQIPESTSPDVWPHQVGMEIPSIGLNGPAVEEITDPKAQPSDTKAADEEETHSDDSEKAAKQRAAKASSDADLAWKAMKSGRRSSFREAALGVEHAIQLYVSGIVEKRIFEPLCALFIGFNACLIGLEVEYSAGNQTTALPIGFKVCEYITVCWFVFELILRLVAVGPRAFFRMQDRIWNMFDVFIVLASLVDVVLMSTSEAEQSSVLLALKVLRIVRLVRIARVVEFFRALRMMVHSMFHTLAALMWFLVLMAIITYCFAICLTQATVDHMIEVLGVAADWEEAVSAGPDYMARMLKDFGSVPRSMYTLLKCVSGGVSWGDPGDLIVELGPGLMCTFLIFICFTIFAMLNVVTGFFCEDAAASAARDRDDIVQEQMRDKEQYIRKFRDVFSEIDQDGSGSMTLDELNAHIEDEHLQAYFSHLQIDASSAWEIFRLLDVDASGTISVEEFVWGCVKLRGFAKTLDVASINYDIERLRRKTFEKLERIESTFAKLASAMQVTLLANGN